jgi:superfamily II DNA or RNA helicase
VEKTRIYQLGAINAINNALYKGIKEQLLVLPCGTGKTYTCVKAIKNKGRVNFIVTTEELMEQAGIALLAELELMPYNQLIATINSCGGLVNLIRKKHKGAELIYNQIGMIKADIFDIDKPIIISSAQTLHNRLDLIPENHFDVIVCDEADLFIAKSHQKFIKYFKYKLLLGLTATPFRTDGLSLKDTFGPTVFEYSIKDAILDRYLTKPIVVKLKTSANLDNVHTLAGEFNQKELTVTVNTPERNYAIANAYIQYGQGRQFITFCCDVQHAIDLCEAFNEKGVKCGYIVGDKELTTDRRGVLKLFHSGELTGLCNVMILSVGYNYDDIGVEIMACPTKSKRKYIQQIGRGMRLKSAKFLERWTQDIIIIDVIDGSSKHLLINTDELDRELELEDKIFISDIARQKIRDAIAKREAKMAEQNREKDEVFELYPLPKVKRYYSARLNEEVTEAQLYRLKSMGYATDDTFYTKNMFAEIMANQSAAKQDIDNLTSVGYDTSRGVSQLEAKLCYDEIILRDLGKLKKQKV